jgi:transcriptional regulator with XRE-family HTH domain
MEMKIDSQKVKQLREARGWSQEHLAEVAELSARTVQRIESDGNASPESRMALAAALGVDATALGLPETAAVPAPACADDRHRQRHDWRFHLLVYVVVCGGLVLLDLSRNGAITWSKWPLLGWGIGLLLRWLRKYGSSPRMVSDR